VMSVCYYFTVQFVVLFIGDRD